MPEKYIKYDSWKTTYETLDLDSYRDANGLLHRNALASRKIKVEFETPHLYRNEMIALMTTIRSAFISNAEQSLNITCYVDEIDDYVTQKCYLVNTQFQIAQNSPQGVIYAPTRIAFVGY